MVKFVVSQMEIKNQHSFNTDTSALYNWSPILCKKIRLNQSGPFWSLFKVRPEQRNNNDDNNFNDDNDDGNNDNIVGVKQTQREQNITEILTGDWCCKGSLFWNKSL